MTKGVHVDDFLKAGGKAPQGGLQGPGRAGGPARPEGPGSAGRRPHPDDPAQGFRKSEANAGKKEEATCHW